MAEQNPNEVTEAATAENAQQTSAPKKKAPAAKKKLQLLKLPKRLLLKSHAVLHLLSAPICWLLLRAKLQTARTR